jgi:serine/threonine-protein phosphatase 5
MLRRSSRWMVSRAQALATRALMTKAIGLDKVDIRKTYQAKDTIAMLVTARDAALKYENVARPTPKAAAADFTTVCGDVHGQGRDFLEIFRLFGTPAVNHPYVFNGDVVDRGPHGAEITLILASYMVAQPGAVIVNRGNHELPSVFSRYGFEDELQKKYAQDFEQVHLAFVGFFNALPVATILDNRIFVVHGGVPKIRDITVDQINALDRDTHDPHRTIDQMLWSDPIPDSLGRGAAFTAADTATFLRAVKCEFMIRSHECKDQGFAFHHDKTCATLFSAPNYCGHMGNKGAIARVKHGAQGSLPEFIQFDAVGVARRK